MQGSQAQGSLAHAASATSGVAGRPQHPGSQLQLAHEQAQEQEQERTSSLDFMMILRKWGGYPSATERRVAILRHRRAILRFCLPAPKRTPYLPPMYRQGALPKGACPRCFAPLSAIVLGASQAQGCRKCGGIFADNALSSRITSILDRAIVADAFAHAARKAAQPLDLHGPKLSCPECSLAMLPNYVQAANVRVDACAEHGTFFDAHELEAVSRAFRRRREAGVPQAPRTAPPLQRTIEASEAAPAEAGIWQLLASLLK